MFQTLKNIGGGLLIIGCKLDASNRILHMFQDLYIVCQNASATSACGLEIKGNIGYKLIDSFSSLPNLNGSLSIVNNRDLEAVVNFSSLVSVRRNEPDSGDLVDLFGGLPSAFNPKSQLVEGFGSLRNVEEDFVILRSPVLKTIILKNLYVLKLQNFFTSNGHSITGFTSEMSLPYIELGCAKRVIIVPLINAASTNGSKGEAILVTSLVSNACKVERLAPNVVRFVIVSLVINLVTASLSIHEVHTHVGKRGNTGCGCTQECIFCTALGSSWCFVRYWLHHKYLCSLEAQVWRASS